MAVRAKATRSTSRRRTVAVNAKSARTAPAVRERPGDRSPAHPRVAVKAHQPTANPSPSPYTKALRFLATLSDYEKMRIVRYNAQTFDLDRMRTLLRKLGNPQDHFRCVHVAGTKGKGSTCAMLAAMLEGNGYKVGLYTSPHLVDIRERIQINGQMISQPDFARLVRMVQPMVLRARPTPTYFDVLTAIAFKYFAEQKVDIAVIETGLGGRLDSTNVVKPEVTAITSISKDHMAQLGGTLEKIAEEKAGIFKPGVPAVTVMQPPEVEAVLKRVAEKVGAPLDITGKTIEFSYRFESSRMLGPHNRVCLTTPQSKFEHLAVPLLGEHQALNCGLALAVIDRLKMRGFALNDQRCMEGLARTQIPGRMELICTNPRVLVDGAHNAASIDAMMRAIGQHIPYDSMVVIFGCCADKDVPGMLERITSGADKVIFTNVNNIRTADPEELAARYVELYGKMAQVAPNLSAALEIANRAVTKEDLICITGSFYLVGEAKKLFASGAAPVRPV
ncbi:bifunctional folylpolyglutamate synthase/dihydrofolate synthase [Fontivita pretiosa]|uniref:bifunctional folylpolyglutamate synthase/dihydrofolate synthase n=1 Tax=Fontivita pretiosa TaxID=2989684 RepID=UPI003D16C145